MSDRLDASFRDPAGFLFRRDGRLYRQVNDCHRDNYDALLASGLYDVLVERGLLVRHAEVDAPPADPSQGSLVIQPDLVPFITYPYEWCPGQLRAAGEATLEIQRLAVGHGLSLRDASAYNIQFVEGRPVLIDTLSFERLREGEPWVAYAQYCRHFLAPLALMRYVDVRLGQVMRTEIDGVPLDLASKLLPWRTRLQVGLLLHVHAHAASRRRHADDGVEALEGRAPRKRHVSKQAMLGLVDSLMNVTRKQRWRPADSAWRDYYAAGESYASGAADHKADIVASMLGSAPCSLVWDLGANTGQFSRLAAKITGAQVVSIEMDPSAVEVSWHSCREEGATAVLPLLNDLSNPSPAQGWGHRERSSLEQRGPADVVLALALVHHVAISNNVPLASFAGWLAELGQRAIVEWVPKQDRMVQRLLATREDVFDRYTEDEFERAFGQLFDVVRKEPVEGSERVIYLLARR